MNIIFNGDFTEAMKDYTYEKVSKVTTFENYESANVKVLVLAEGKFNVEISLDNSVRAEKTGDDFYELIIDVVKKLTSQIIRYKKYIQSKCKRAENIVEVEDDESGYVISKEKMLILDETDRDSAIENMEALGHSFFVYRDIDLGNTVCIIYKRHAGDYGIIECK